MPNLAQIGSLHMLPVLHRLGDAYGFQLFLFSCCYYLYSRCQLGWMCPLKREQARRERECELRLVNSL